MSHNTYFARIGSVAEQLWLAANAAQQMKEFGPQPTGTFEKHIGVLVRELMAMVEAEEQG